MMENVAVAPQIEAVLLTADSALTAKQIQQLFPEEAQLTINDIKAIIAGIQQKYGSEDQVLELVEVASGFRFQVKSAYNQLVRKLKQSQQPKCSRALLETLAIIAYQQPVTRAQIEEIRGVRVNTNIMKQLFEYGWIQQTGELELPGRPALYSTTRQFLDDFGLLSAPGEN